MRRILSVLGLGVLVLSAAGAAPGGARPARAAEAEEHTPLPRPAWLPKDAFAVGVVRSYGRFTDTVVKIADAGHEGAGQMAKAVMGTALQAKLAVQLFNPARPVAVLVLDPKKYGEDCMAILAPVVDPKGYTKKLGEVHGAPAAEGEDFTEFEVVQPGAAPDKTMRVQDAGGGYVAIAYGERAAEAAAAVAAAFKAAGGTLGAVTDDVRVLVDLAKLVGLYEKEIQDGLKAGRAGMKQGVAMVSGMMGGGAVAAGGPNAQCRENLQMIAIACQMYAIDHDGAFPPRIEDLFKGYIDSKKCFSCPVRGGGGTDYAYVVGLRTDDKGETILAFDRAGNHADGTVNAVLVSGEVKSLQPAEFQKTRAAQSAAFQAAGRKVTLLQPPAPGAAPEEAAPVEAGPGPASLEEFGKELLPNLLAVVGNLIDPGFDLAGAVVKEFEGAELVLSVADATEAGPGAGQLTVAMRLYPAKGSRSAVIVSQIKAPGAETAALARLLPTKRPVAFSVGGGETPEESRKLTIETLDVFAKALQPLLPEKAFWTATRETLRLSMEHSRANANAQLARSDTAQANLILQRVEEAAALRAAITKQVRALLATRILRNLARFGIAVEFKEGAREHAGVKIDRAQLKIDLEKLLPGEAQAMQRQMAENMISGALEAQFGTKEPAVEFACGKGLLVVAYGKDASPLVDGVLDRAGGAANGKLPDLIARAPEGWVGASEVYPIQALSLAWARQKLQQQRMLKAMGAGPEGEAKLELPAIKDRHPIRCYVLRKGSMAEMRLLLQISTIQDVSAFVKQTFVKAAAEGMGEPPLGEQMELEEVEEMEELEELDLPEPEGIVE